MREILFRGKRLDNGEWIQGDLFQRLGHYPEIIIHHPNEEGKVAYSSICVAPSTVGQYTGLKDKNGTKIFEGDVICSYDTFGDEIKHYVHYIDSECSFCVALLGYNVIDYNAGNIYQRWIDEFKKEVVGNIHDNPELMNGGER